MGKEFITSSEAETEMAAREFGATLPGRQIVFLEGTLGAGKSVFARALIRSLTGDPEKTVPSPTFTLLQTYDTGTGPIWHYDLYRLKDPEEMVELSWDDALISGIVLIEWPEKLGYLKPEGITITIDTIPGQPESRRIRIDK
jgi:tRNA threonylcarbamoyl adenosine modification protein YjeE